MQITALDSTEDFSTSSPARLAANRANAQLSTGPNTFEGKLRSRVNAVKCGLTGATVLLPTEDAAAYENHVRAYQEELRPAGPRESALVQSLADTDWRLNRIPSLEAAFYARGKVELEKRLETVDPDLRPSIIQLETYLAYEKQLRNLHLQESRLHRRRTKDAAELRELKSARNAAVKQGAPEEEALPNERGAPAHQHATAAGAQSDVGFVFSFANSTFQTTQDASEVLIATESTRVDSSADRAPRVTSEAKTQNG